MVSDQGRTSLLVTGFFCCTDGTRGWRENMIKSYRIFFLFLLTPTFSQASTPAQASLVPMVCAFPSDDLPPYIYGEGLELRTERPGITIERFQTIIENAKGIDLVIKRLPYARMAKDITAGTVDCIVSAEASHYVVPRTPEGTIKQEFAFDRSQIVLYYNKNLKVSWDGKQLKPSVPVHSPIAEFNKFGLDKGLTVVTDNLSIERHLKQLESGRIKALLSLESLTDPLIQRSYKDKIKKNAVPIETLHVYIAFSKQFFKQNPKACQKIWEASVGIDKDKKYKQRLMKYRAQLE